MVLARSLRSNFRLFNFNLVFRCRFIVLSLIRGGFSLENSLYAYKMNCMYTDLGSTVWAIAIFPFLLIVHFCLRQRYCLISVWDLRKRVSLDDRIRKRKIRPVLYERMRSLTKNMKFTAVNCRDLFCLYNFKAIIAAI